MGFYYIIEDGTYGLEGYIAVRCDRMSRGKDRLVKVTHYERDPVNGPGQMVTRPYNLKGEPFIVFCSNNECEHYWDRPGAIPHWSEDCKEYLGVLRCPACGRPVVKPRGPS